MYMVIVIIRLGRLGVVHYTIFFIKNDLIK